MNFFQGVAGGRCGGQLFKLHKHYSLYIIDSLTNARIKFAKEIISELNVCTSESVAKEETQSNQQTTCQISVPVLADMSANHYIGQTDENA